LRHDPARLSEAEAAYRQAIALNPKDASPWNNLGNLLSDDPARVSEAETAYRRAIELDPKYANPWNNLGNLLSDDPARTAEAEAAYRHAIALDSKDAYPRSGLAWLMQLMGRINDECRQLATEGLRLKPDYTFACHQFESVCFTDAPSLCSALPALSAWCGEHPEADEVFQFTIDAWIALAKAETAGEALALLDSLPETARLPFDLVREAFLAHADKDNLQRLAPERRTPVLKLLELIGTGKKRQPRSAK
ncbi:MAG: hypothetical protein JWO94_2608, partial [Verrucomicrobiaceae bacterium]|nr:hypothetical protein [Verrucomicrobiaceae bacterium]